MMSPEITARDLKPHADIDARLDTEPQYKFIQNTMEDEESPRFRTERAHSSKETKSINIRTEEDATSIFSTPMHEREERKQTP